MKNKNLSLNPQSVNETLEEDSNQIFVRDSVKAKKHFIVALLALLIILISNFVILLKPLYTKIYYGQVDPVFFYAFNAIVMIALFFVLKFLVIKKMNAKPNKVKIKRLSNKRLVILILLCVLTIFIISAFCGFNIKIIYDIGEKFTFLELYAAMAKWLFYAAMLLNVTLIIEHSQYAFESLFDLKKSKFILLPLGGLFSMLTFGIYHTIFGINSFWFIYLLLNILFGFIYLFTHRSFGKTYVLSLLIYFF
ncbi:MAG: hypothetical protein ACRC5M_03135 [Anaeroplasmataceae bacterium]